MDIVTAACGAPAVDLAGDGRGAHLPGPGDDAVFSAEYLILLLIVLGALPPAVLLYRRTRPR